MATFQCATRGKTLCAHSAGSRIRVATARLRGIQPSERTGPSAGAARVRDAAGFPVALRHCAYDLRRSAPSHAPSRLVPPTAAQVGHVPQHGVASNHLLRNGTIAMLRMNMERTPAAYKTFFRSAAAASPNAGRGNFGAFRRIDISRPAPHVGRARAT